MNASFFNVAQHMAPLHARWQVLAPRERLAVGLAAWVLGLGLLWWLALSPALQTLRAADLQRVELDRQLQVMQALQTEAKSLQGLSKLGSNEALRALEASVKQRLGSSAQLNVVGDRATVTVKAVSGEALSQWLAQARANARALPTEARLTRSPMASAATSDATATPAATPPTVTWDGNIVLRLP